MLKFLVFGVVLVGGLSFARAEGPCAADRAKFCGDVKMGEGAMMKCMHSHKDELSAGCKEHWTSMKSEMKEAHEACHGDVEKLCGDVKRGKGRIVKCLREHKDQLSDGCKAEFEKMKEKHSK